MRKIPYRALLALSALAVVMACGGGEAPVTETAPAAAPAPAAPTGTAVVSGSVTYSGDDPDTQINMAADPKCQELNPEPVMTQRVEVDDAGGLANVFVYVKTGISGSFSPPSEPVVLDQQGCRYHPHVFGVMTGQTVKIRNSDETLHNIHATPGTNREFNQGQPFQGMEFEKTFDRVEVMVPYKCDVHPWMSAYMGVLDHPFFAVSGADGSFAIDELPAGTYTVEAWHELGGTQTQEVTVADGETVEIAFAFAPAG